jgi:hypothetical protein
MLGKCLRTGISQLIRPASGRRGKLHPKTPAGRSAIAVTNSSGTAPDTTQKIHFQGSAAATFQRERTARHGKETRDIDRIECVQQELILVNCNNDSCGFR